MRRAASIAIIIGLAAVVVTASLAGQQVRSTSATYSDSISARASIQATDGAPVPPPPPPPCGRLTLLPGCSRAYYVSGPCPSPRVARIDKDGKLYLDYGEILQDGVMRSTEVFLARNSTNETLRLRCSVEGTIAVLFRSYDLSPVKVKPGAVATFLSVIEPHGALPGLYEGFVRLKDPSHAIDISIPVRIVVLEKAPCGATGSNAPDAVSPVSQEQPAANPQPVIEASVTPAPSEPVTSPAGGE